MGSHVVNNIDIGAVREQLLLLGHHVDDDTIVHFVRGLNLENDAELGPGSTAEKAQTRAGASSRIIPQTADRSGTVTERLYTPPVLKPGPSRPFCSTASADAAPTKSSQQDQSAEPPPTSLYPSIPSHAGDASPPPKTLDQRCRAFLSKMAAAHPSPGASPPRTSILSSNRLSHAQPAATALDAEPYNHPQQVSWNTKSSTQMRRSPAVDAGSSSSSGGSSVYTTDDDSEDSDEDKLPADTARMTQFALRSRSPPKDHTNGSRSSANPRSLYDEWSALQEHQPQQARQSNGPLNGSSSNRSSSSSGRNWPSTYDDARAGEQHLRSLQLGAVPSAAAPTPAAPPASARLGRMPQAAAPGTVIIKDISRSRLHSNTTTTTSSSSQGAVEHDPGDYLTKLSLSIHPSAGTGWKADTTGPGGPAGGSYPSLLPSLTQEQQHGMAPSDLSRSSSDAAAEPMAPRLRAGTHISGDSDILEIPDWALRAYGLPDGYKAVGVHLPPEPAPDSLTADALRQRQQGAQQQQQQQLEQRYISAAATVDAALMGKDAANSAPGSAADAAERAHSDEHEAGVARPLGLRIPTEACHGSNVVGMSPKPYSPMGGHVLGGLGLDGAQHESIIASSSAERGIGGHCTMRRMPSPKGPLDPLYKAPTSPGRATANLKPMPMRPLMGPSPTSLRRKGRAAAGQPLPAAAAGGSGAGLQAKGQQAMTTRGLFSGADTGRSKRGDQSNPPPAVGAVGGAGDVRGGGGVLGPCKSSSGFSTAGSSSRAVAYRCSLDSTRSMYSCGFNSKVKGLAPGVKKVDRVARYKEMQQQWDKDRFLRSGAGGAPSTVGRASPNAPGMGLVRWPKGSAGAAGQPTFDQDGSYSRR